MAKTRTVRGDIELPPEAGSFMPAQVLIVLEDVSRADAPSRAVKSLKLSDIALRGSDRIPFALRVHADAVNEQSTYSVRVHVDVSGSGEIEKGDFITMQSYPVLTRGHGDKIRVAVRRV